jgi:hypothetical protein
MTTLVSTETTGEVLTTTPQTKVEIGNIVILSTSYFILFNPISEQGESQSKLVIAIWEKR